MVGRTHYPTTCARRLATIGATAGPACHEGVAVFTLIKGGLMGQATSSGAKFTFKPLSE